MEKDVIKKNWIKAYIVDVLPCITVAVYVLAIIYNIAYFSVFNINILHYLSFSDMLLSILDTLVVFAFISLFLIWYTLFFLTSIIADEDRLEKFKKERMGKHLWRFVPIKIVRLYIKIKNSEIGKRFIEYKKKQDEQEKQYIQERQKRKEEQEKNPYYHSWKEFIGASFIMVISYNVYILLIEKGALDTGMAVATIALLFPIILYCVMPVALYVDKHLFGLPVTKQMYFRRYKPIALLEIILVYYIYAVTIFYKSGVESGKYYKNNDVVEFSIKTNDGTEFNDSSYRYINILNERVFLLEKSTNKNLILTNDGIAYIKVDFKDASTQSAIVRTVTVKNKIKEKIKNKMSVN